MKRKIYDQLLLWKEKRKGKSAMMIEGARRVGKSYIVKKFAQREYKSFILLAMPLTSGELSLNNFTRKYSKTSWRSMLAC